MLPVASEALSLAAHPPAKNGGGKPDSAAKSPFETMLDGAPGEPAPATASASATAPVAAKGAGGKAEPAPHGLIVPLSDGKLSSNNKDIIPSTPAPDGADAPGAPGQPGGPGAPGQPSPDGPIAVTPADAPPDSEAASGMDVDTVLKTGEALLFVDVGPKVWPTAGSGVSQPQAAGKVTAKSTNKAGDDKETTDKPAAKAAEPTVAVSPAPVAAAAPAAPTVVPTAPASDATSVAPDPSSMPSAGIRLAQNVIEPAVKSPGDQGAAVPDRQPAAANGTAALPLPEAKMDRTNVPQASTSAPPPAPPANTPAKADANAPAKAASAQPAVGHAAPSQDVAAPAPAKLAPTDHDRQPAGDAPKTGPDTTTQPLNVIQTAAPSSNAATVAAAKPTDAATQSPIAVAVPIEGVAVAIASKAADGKKSFDIRLDPPDLGRIHVHLDVDSSGQITSHVIADRSDTLDLLRRDSSGLERAFQDAGLKTSSNGLQFSLRDQSQGQTGQQQQPMPSSHLIVADEPTIDTPAPVYRLLTGARGGLDIRV